MTSWYHELCLPVTVTHEADEFDIDSSWIAGAFFLGLFVGGGIAAIIAPICLRDWEKKKKQDEEERMLIDMEREDKVTAKHVTPVTPIAATNTGQDVEEKPKGRLASLFRRKSSKKSQAGHKEKNGVVGWVDDEAAPGSEKQPLISSGMGVVLAKSTTADAEAECVSQDIEAFRKLDDAQKRAKDDLSVKMLKLRLRKMKDKGGKITDPYLADFTQKIIANKKTSQDVLSAELKEAEDEARKKHAKNPKQLEHDLEVLGILHSQKQRQMEKDEMENIRSELLKTSGLTESEVDELLEKHKMNMAELERRQGLEQARQARHLAERLEKRRQILEFRRLQEQQNNDEFGQETEAFSEPLDKMIADGKLLQRQRDELLSQHAENVDKLRKQHELENARRQQDLETKLRERREQRMRKLAEKQERERALYLEKANKASNPEEFLKGYQDLVQHHQAETEELETELDQGEIQAMEKITTAMEAQKDEQIRQMNDKFVQTVQTTGQLSESDADRIIKLHKLRMQGYEMKRKEEKQRMKQRLMEKWEQRLRKLEEQEQLETTEKETLNEQQGLTVKKVLDSNLELSEEAREKILREHERNMVALNNQLARSKQKQQLVLEQKLSQRRARLAEIQRQHEQNLQKKKAGDAKEVESLEEKLRLEVMLFEKEKKEAEESLRQHLAAETAAALTQQESEIAALIGRLEVGHARRQAVLQKQDKTLKQLQEQLESRMEHGGGMASHWADQIIQQHYNQVEHINDTIQHSRERQEQLINEKLQAKRFKRQRELEDELKREKQEMMYARRQAGTGVASQILNNVYMEQRQKKAMEELEKEMQLELERSKEQLNDQLQQSLERELEQHKGEFLNQLAAASNMSKQDIQEAVNTAVTDTGGDRKTATKLQRDLQSSMTKARSSLGMIEEDDDSDSVKVRKRPQSAVRTGSRSSIDHPAPRPRASKQPVPTKPRAVPGFSTSTGEKVQGMWEMEDDTDSDRF